MKPHLSLLAMVWGNVAYTVPWLIGGGVFWILAVPIGTFLAAVLGVAVALAVFHLWGYASHRRGWPRWLYAPWADDL